MRGLRGYVDRAMPKARTARVEVCRTANAARLSSVATAARDIASRRVLKRASWLLACAVVVGGGSGASPSAARVSSRTASSRAGSCRPGSCGDGPYSGTFSGTRTIMSPLRPGTDVTVQWQGHVKFGNLPSPGDPGVSNPLPPSGTFYSVSSGSVSWTVSGTVQGDCKVSGSGTKSLTDGGFEAWIMLDPYNQYSATINSDAGPPEDYSLPATVTGPPHCPPSDAVFTNPLWLDAGGRAVPGGNFTILDGSKQEPRLRTSWAWNLTGRGERLAADPGGPYSATRGGKVHLDGSRSTPNAVITSYRWTYQLVSTNCPEGAEVDPSAGSDKAKTTIVVLCDVRATLTVRDKQGHTADGWTIVKVDPRSADVWRTPTDLTLNYRKFLPIFHLPTQAIFGDSPPWLAGVNGCPNGNYRSHSALCETGPIRSWHHHYEFSKVTDPDGPFDGWYYVARTGLKLERVAYIDPYISPGGPPPETGEPDWYQYNLNRGIDVATLLSNVAAHEGYGLGAPSSGHMQLMIGALDANQGHDDPRRYLEGVIGPSESHLETKIDDCLSLLDRVIYDYAKDPLVPFAVPPTLYDWNGLFYQSTETLPSPPFQPRVLEEPGCSNK